MGKIRRGLSLAKVISLRSRVADLEAQLKQHKLICADCALHEDSAKHACAEGWRLMKDKAHADNALTVYIGFTGGTEIKGQGLLF